MPVFHSRHGICNLNINEKREANGREEWMSKEENSWTYTLLASSINIGLKLLETPEGKNALIRLGQFVIREWHTTNTHRFGGNINRMDRYVDHFLSSLRRDFPLVNVVDLGGPDVLAAAQRIDPFPGLTWDGNLDAYWPKGSVGFYFNSRRVADMVAAASAMGSTGLTARSRSRADSNRMARRHKGFQFMFAVATAHELCHAFVAYLSQNEVELGGYTPPNVSYLNYQVQYSTARGPNGESGRWFESILFGGSIEFYRNERDDHGQVGIAHVLNQEATAFPIDPAFINGMVQSPPVFQFPFPTSGTPITQAQRVQRRLRSLGSTNSGGPLPQGLLYMRSRHVGPVLAYNVTEEQLRGIPVSPRPLRAQRVAA
ncbi:hypothetical protein FALBO_4209 [Fusarium albosuccineum]|uniref:Uncharacterized protein n=1 Tax=Fusarium albosuccineum TaxID=1237068 RepID=A0A8H4LIS1_9HYPO|nr:hypothetical protein FALBO_4209 [Fusarium albosuccineum]